MVQERGKDNTSWHIPIRQDFLFFSLEEDAVISWQRWKREDMSAR